jgi:predicted RNA-binding Zn ribbon-like protein
MQSLELLKEFVNTELLEEAEEHLDSPAALGRWLAGHGLANGMLRPVAADLRNARALRDALRELALFNNGVDADAEAAAATLEWTAQRARLAVRFGEDGELRFEASAAGVPGALGRLVAAAATAMAEGSWGRFKACRADSCRFAFVDESSNASRVWCSMDVCGNREKARRFRESR